MIETEEAIEPTGIPSPEESARRPDVEGDPVVMGDGRPWILPKHVPQFEPVWDRLYDANCLTQKYSSGDILLAASKLLLANYDLTVTAAATLIVGANLGELVIAVENALFGPERTHNTWSDWAIGSMFANGINPADVPPDRLLSVLDVLVATGRTIPPGRFISSAEAGSYLRKIKSRIPATQPPHASPAPSFADPSAMVTETVVQEHPSRSDTQSSD